MFELFNVPAFYLAVSGVLALYASGGIISLPSPPTYAIKFKKCKGETGLVMDMGHEISRAIPIYSGHVLQGCVESMEIGGRQIASYFQELVVASNSSYNPNSVNLEMFEVMKREFCHVAFDNLSEGEKENEKTYELPDGQAISMGSKEAFSACELLFSPPKKREMGTDESKEEDGKEEERKELGKGIHEVAYKALDNCFEDIKNELCENICICGGSLFPNFDKRFEKELGSLFLGNEKNMGICKRKGEGMNKSKIREYPGSIEPKLVAWVGGSIISCLSSFQDVWICKDEYDEMGVNIVHRRCF